MNPRVEVHPDGEALATSVAGELLGRLLEIQEDDREPHIVLAGGTIARKVYAEVARLTPTSGVDWTRVVVWWGDERFVDVGSEDRNDAQSRADILDAVGATQMHPMPHLAQTCDVHTGAAEYADLLEAEGPDLFDVLMLGVGPDGHIASLFPGKAGLGVHDRATVGVTDSPKPPAERISLTFPRLNRSTAVWFLVSGGEKAEAVEAALSLEGDVSEIPARGVDGHSETIWFLDKSAASFL